MERMEEVIPEADHQALQHRVNESAWAERAVLDPVAQDAKRLFCATRRFFCKPAYCLITPGRRESIRTFVLFMKRTS